MHASIVELERREVGIQAGNGHTIASETNELVQLAKVLGISRYFHRINLELRNLLNRKDLIVPDDVEDSGYMLIKEPVYDEGLAERIGKEIGPFYYWLLTWSGPPKGERKFVEAFLKKNSPLRIIGERQRQIHIDSDPEEAWEILLQTYIAEPGKMNGNSHVRSYYHIPEEGVLVNDRGLRTLRTG